MNRRSLDSSSQPGSFTGQRAVRSRSKSLATPPSGGPFSSPFAQQPEQEQHHNVSPATVLRKIPRPPNAFILYRSNKMRELARQETQPRFDTGLSKLDYQRQLSKRIGELWRNETPQVKATFYEKASQAAQEHALRYPDYRYNPSTRKSGVSKRTETSSSVSTARVDKTLEIKLDTDFSPGELSGPVAGFGSGSGRRRASLDSARAKNAPYPPTRHRTAPSSGSSSPSTSRATRQHSPVLCPGKPEAAIAQADRVPLVRSASQATDRHSYRLEGERQSSSSARRSFDGYISRASTSRDSLDTLLPQPLRDQPHVFLAPIGPPPIPIGQAITTNDAASASEAQAQQQHRSGTKVTLAEAVKRALPPERRALLHASLAKKGLLPAAEAVTPAECCPSVAPIDERKNSASTPGQYTSDEPTPPLTHAEFWGSFTSCAGEVDSQKVFLSQQAFPMGTADPQSSTSHELDSWWPYGIAPRLGESHHRTPFHSEPAASANIVMGATDAAKYSTLADWTQPGPCWSNYAVERTSASRNIDQLEATFPSHTAPYFQNEGAVGQVSLQQGDTEQQDANSGMAAPQSCFHAIYSGQFGRLGYDIGAANSAVVALSDPNERGQVSGHMYSLDGELIGQGTVGGNVSGTNEGNGSETERQNRAVLELLQQMMDSNSEISRGTQRLLSQSEDGPLLPSLDNSATFNQPTVPSQQQVGHQESWQPDWQAWPADLQPTSYVNVDRTNTPPAPYSIASQDQLNFTTYSDVKGCAKDASLADARHSIATSYATCQERKAVPSHVTSPTNFSRPMTAQDGFGPTTNAEGHVAFQETSLLEAGGCVVSHYEHVQEPGDTATRSAPNKGLRSWKSSQLSSIKEKLAWIKNRGSTSTSSLAAPPHQSASTEAEHVPN